MTSFFNLVFQMTKIHAYSQIPLIYTTAFVISFKTMSKPIKSHNPFKFLFFSLYLKVIPIICFLTYPKYLPHTIITLSST